MWIYCYCKSLLLKYFLKIFSTYTEDLRSELGGSDNGSGTGSSAALPVPKGAAPQLDAEKHFLPFELACQSKSARIVVTALDCIQVWYIIFLLIFNINLTKIVCKCQAFFPVSAHQSFSHPNRNWLPMDISQAIVQTRTTLIRGSLTILWRPYATVSMGSQQTRM